MSGFRGYNQAAGTPQKIGVMSQRQLLATLRIIIDTAQAKAASKTRDDARRTLRELMAAANWNTPYIRRNLGTKRCRYLRGLGYDIPLADATRSTIDRLNLWRDRNGY